MSLYTRARKHIDMDRVKELREEKIKREQIAKLVQEQERIRAELEYIEAEESKYINWRCELEEGMNTSGMGMINLPSQGDVNLGAAMGNISLSGDGGLSGYNAITRSSTSSYKEFDTMVVTITTTSSDWVISPSTGPIITVGEGGAGNHTVVIPASYSGLYFSAKDDGTFSASVQYQRRAPVNVFVSLDDPDSSAFVRDGDFDRLSNQEKKKKLEEQLRSSDEYLKNKFGEGMPKSATISDVQPQQSFADIAAAQQGPIRPGPRGYKKPGTYDPNKFYDLKNDPSQLPSPNLPATGPGYSSIPDGTKVAASYPKPDPLDKLLKDIDDADKKLKNQPPGTRPGKGRGMGDRWDFNKFVKGKGNTMVAHHEPQGKVIKEKKSFKDITKKIPGYYDGKPSPLGFPVEEPPKMKNGFHPDLVDGKKVANRFNRLDPQSAKAMPKTGNPHIDKKVRAAAKKPK